MAGIRSVALRLPALALAAALLSCSAAAQLANGTAHERHCEPMPETLQIGVITAADAAISFEGRPYYASFYFADPRSKADIDNFRGATQATPESLAKLGIRDPWALVEFESNCGDSLGASHVFLTSMRRLDGTPDYPLDLTDVVAQLSARNEELLAAHSDAMDAMLVEQAKLVFLPRSTADPSLLAGATTTTVPLLYWDHDALIADFQTRREIVEMGNACGTEPAEGETCQTISAQVTASLLVRFTVDRTGKLVDEQVTAPTVTGVSFPPPQ